MAFLPGWNSIESAALFHGIFEKAAIFMLVLFVVALVLSYAYGHRKDHLNDEAMRDAAEERQAVATERQLADAERLIAEVAREKERAEEVALVQKQQLTEAEARLDQARKEVRAAATKPVEVARPQGDVRPLGDLSSDSDRHLTDGQRLKLRAFLEKQEKGNLVIKANPFVLDAHSYGQQISEAFRQLGWNVRMDNESIPGSDVTGMWFTLKGAESIPVGTGALHAALEHAQIPVGTQPRWDPKGPEMNQIWLVIGKPQ